MEKDTAGRQEPRSLVFKHKGKQRQKRAGNQRQEVKHGTITQGNDLQNRIPKYEKTQRTQ